MKFFYQFNLDVFEYELKIVLFSKIYLKRDCICTFFTNNLVFYFFFLIMIIHNIKKNFSLE